MMNSDCKETYPLSSGLEFPRMREKVRVEGGKKEGIGQLIKVGPNRSRSEPWVR